MRILALIAAFFMLACEAADAPIVTEVSLEEFTSKPAGTYLIFDVRTPAEYEAGHITRSINIPHDVVAENLPRFQKYAGVPVMIYCKSGRRAHEAAKVFAAAGFTNLNHLTGGMDAWIEAGLPVATNGP